MDLRFGIIYVKRVILGKRLGKEEKNSTEMPKREKTTTESIPNTDKEPNT